MRRAGGVTSDAGDPGEEREGGEGLGFVCGAVVVLVVCNHYWLNLTLTVPYYQECGE
jgi:hypothetical protein